MTQHAIRTAIKTIGFIVDGKLQLSEDCAITKIVKRIRLEHCNRFENAYFISYVDKPVYITITNILDKNQIYTYTGLDDLSVSCSICSVIIINKHLCLRLQFEKNVKSPCIVSRDIMIFENIPQVDFSTIMQHKGKIIVDTFTSIIKESHQIQAQIQEQQRTARQFENNQKSKSKSNSFFSFMNKKEKQLEPEELDNTKNKKDNEEIENKQCCNAIHDQLLCVICLCNQKNTYINCGHVCMCTTCAPNYKECPICSVKIDMILPAYI